MSCHRKQLIEALGYDFKDEVEKYWHDTDNALLRQVAETIARDFDLINHRLIGYSDELKLGGLTAQPMLYDESRTRTLMFNNSSVVRKGVIDPSGFSELLFSLHVVFTRDGDAYKYSDEDVKLLFNTEFVGAEEWALLSNVKYLSVDMFRHERRQIFKETWSQGELGLEDIPEVLDYLRTRE